LRTLERPLLAGCCEESEGGNHFMFMENPEKVNRIVKEFMG
jgi:pimeloyl-ACP methyl ester carboxylesterase